MPLKIPVGRIGQWKHPKYGLINMNQKTFDDMIGNFKAKTIGRDPFVRIGHDKEGNPTFGGAKAEGWITDLVQQGEYLFAVAEPTNADIADMVQNKQYRYASAEYQDNYQSKEDGSFKGAVLEALALTNEPFLTRLPEARLLADSPETFYLDHEEVHSKMENIDQLLEEQKQTNGLLKKLAEGFAGLTSYFSSKKPEESGDQKPEPKPPEVIDPSQKLLADQVKSLQDQLSVTRHAQHEAEVNKKLSDYVQQGIPPAVIDQVKPILLADIDQAKIIKLSDDKVLSATEQVYEMLNNFPQSSRIQLSQVGSHSAPTGDEKAEEESRKLSEACMIDLGYTLVDGKFKM